MAKTPCKVLLTSIERRWCSNATKTWNRLKFAGVPQTCQQISAVSGPKFTILWGHVEEILLFNKFFSDCRYMPHLWRYSRTKLCNGAQMAIFCVLYFSEPRAYSRFQTCILNSHYGHIMCGSMVDIQFENQVPECCRANMDGVQENNETRHIKGSQTPT